ncbi:MAG: hypothetical protein O3B95_05655 [Chloroflexi bacterium]|nr:hypothetical protein [Chloroflexota bacterium]
MTVSPARRNQLIIAGLSSLLLMTLWTVGNLPRYMYFALPFVVGSLWIPAVLFEKQCAGSLGWNLFFGAIGVAVVLVVGRAVWLIGRG